MLQLLDGFFQLGAGIGAKVKEAHVGDAIFAHLRLDDRDVDAGPDDLHLKGLLTFAQNGQDAPAHRPVPG